MSQMFTVGCASVRYCIYRSYESFESDASLTASKCRIILQCQPVFSARLFDYSDLLISQEFANKHITHLIVNTLSGWHTLCNRYVQSK